MKSSRKTFGNDDSLPPLPLPPLSHTLSKYLTSLEPLLDEQELNEAKEIVERFGQSPEADRLQGYLIKKAEQNKNWVIYQLTDLYSI